MRIAGIGRRKNFNRQRGRFIAFHQRRDVKRASRKRAFHLAHLLAIHPDRRDVVDAVEMQPDMLALDVVRRDKLGAIPVIRARQTLGDFVRPIVFAIQRLGVDAVVHETG